MTTSSAPRRAHLLANRLLTNRVVVIALGAVVFTACRDEAPPPHAGNDPSSQTPPEPMVTKVDGTTAKTLIRQGARIIDVRSPEEYAEGHIDGADNIPVDSVWANDLGPKDRPVVVYCRSGKRSNQAAETLKAKGYLRIYDLGGMSNFEH